MAENKTGVGCGTLVLLCILFWIVVCLVNPSPKPDGGRDRPGVQPSGEGSVTSGQCVLFADAKSFDAATEAAVYGDHRTIEEMAVADRAVIIPAGTRIQVVGSAGFLKRRVRILSGPHTGRTGVVAADYVQQ